MINFEELSFFQGLRKFSREVEYRYCIPGHDKCDEIINFLASNLSDFDVTETIGTDDLNCPDDFIKNALEELSEIYHTKRTFISVNGSSGSLINAILSVTKPKDKILIQRDCHKSVFNACVLGDLEAEYINPMYDETRNLNLGIDPRKLREKLRKNSDIVAVVVTYPTYTGICSDIEKIARICHESGTLLIVDEAHGSHLAFSDQLPIAAEIAGADIVVQSIHKTLPALTQTSLLHVCSDRVDESRIEKMFKLTITSSPSYIFMASIVAAVNYMKAEGNTKISNILLTRKKCELKYAELAEVFLNKEKIIKYGGYDFDSTRPIMTLKDIDISGKSLESILRNDYGVAMEYSDLTYCVGYFFASDSTEKIEYLYKAVDDIYKKQFALDAKNVFKKLDSYADFEYNKYKYPDYLVAMNMREAFYEDSEEIDLDESENCISSDFIIPYPPGIPLICAGEIITEDMIIYIKKLEENDNKIYGIKENKLRIIRR